jgi:hypothetical protein
MKRYVGKKASIATGVVTAFLAAAPGSSQATPTGAQDASALSGGSTVSEAAMDAIKSKAEDINMKVAATKGTPPVVKPIFSRRTVFVRAGPPTFVRNMK